MTAAGPPPLTDLDWAVRFEAYDHFARLVEAPTVFASSLFPVASGSRAIQSSNPCAAFRRTTTSASFRTGTNPGS